MKISFTETSGYPHAETIDRLRHALVDEGLGIVSEMNVQETFQSKLDKRISPYVILGVCHPPTAFQLLEMDKTLGVLLPCNILVYEEAGNIMVTTVAPTSLIGAMERAELMEIAQDIEAKLQRVIQTVR